MMNTNAAKKLLKTAATLPAGTARRVAGAIMAAEAGEKRGDSRHAEEAAETNPDVLLEAAAAAMQRAMERAVLAQLETILE